jgi:hypothetical protein
MRIASAALSLLMASSAMAAQAGPSTPLMGYAGTTYLHENLRISTGRDWGYAAGVAATIAEQGLLGLPSADIDVRYSPGPAGELLAVETSYAERALISERVWIGLGIGANYVKLSLEGSQQPGDERESHRWAAGGKAMLGYLLSDRLFLEGSFHRTGTLLGIDTSSTSICLGYWF